MMREKWNEVTHPDCKLDCMSDDLPDFNDIPFIPADYSPLNKKEKASADYAVMCCRGGLEYCEPQELLRMHKSDKPYYRINLTPEQVSLVQDVIQTLDSEEN